MPQETPSKENNKSKPRFGRRRKNYVDSFRWGFVAEEGSDISAAKSEKEDDKRHPADSGKEKPHPHASPKEKNKVKNKSDEKTKSPLLDEGKSALPSNDRQPPPPVHPDSTSSTKRSRTRKDATKTTDAKPTMKTKEAPKTKPNGDTAAKSAVAKQHPKVSSTPLPKQSAPGKRPTKSKRQSKSALPSYITAGYDENDEDLKLPSYGRTPVPTDDELPIPQKIISKQSPKTSSATATPESIDVVSGVSSGGFRLRREQMVWDPDKSEYVPLVVAEEPSKKDSRRQTANGKRQMVDNKRQTADSSKKSTTVPLAQLPKERPQHSDSRRNRQPQFVDSSKPDPADIEAEASGFAELGVSETMLEALKIVRYLEPTPIQAGVFKKVQAGTDLMGQARTGTGKTAAFSIPIIEEVEKCPPGNDPVALILVPTRELAVQVRDEAIRLAFGRDIRITALYGGKPLAKQIERLRHGVDIVVGTPGRILDLLNRRALTFNSIRWIVLDEADRMLDIGFRPDIEKILKRTPQERQTLLFSATLPAPVVRLAERYMKSPEVLDFSDKSVAVETIDQFYVTVDPERKFDALVYLLQEQEPKQAIIFTRTKRGADRLARLLSNRFDKLATIHGDLQQSDRDRVMAQVRAGSVRYLVATDVVGRGIDVTGISHIINYDIPKFCDDYVHRVGRTGRMGRDGIAFTFVTVQEGSELTRIEMRIDKLLKRAELKGFESFTKPHDPNASLDDDNMPEPPKPVFGKPVRKVRRAL